MSRDGGEEAESLAELDHQRHHFALFRLPHLECVGLDSVRVSYRTPPLLGLTLRGRFWRCTRLRAGSIRGLEGRNRRWPARLFRTVESAAPGRVASSRQGDLPRRLHRGSGGHGCRCAHRDRPGGGDHEPLRRCRSSDNLGRLTRRWPTVPVVIVLTAKAANWRDRETFWADEPEGYLW